MFYSPVSQITVWLKQHFPGLFAVFHSRHAVFKVITNSNITRLDNAPSTMLTESSRTYFFRLAVLQGGTKSWRRKEEEGFNKWRKSQRDGDRYVYR